MEAAGEKEKSTNSGDGRRDHVMSEVHLGCPPGHSDSYLSRFTLYSPSLDSREDFSCESIALDEQGDLNVPRRKNKSGGRPASSSLVIQHMITSSIPSVGLQVWKAALVLADFVLHKIFTSSDFNDIVALELGAGTGLVGIVLARVAKIVFLTDRDAEILDNCASNVLLNSESLKYREQAAHVRVLNWEMAWPPTVGPPTTRYGWSSWEVCLAEKASLLLAADVIYSDNLTDSLFDTLEGLMSRGTEKVLYLSLEKRYNFSLDELDIVANGYSHFQKHLEHEGTGEGKTSYFIGKRIDITEIPQYVREYERGNDLEIWQIRILLLELKKMASGTAWTRMVKYMLKKAECFTLKLRR